MTDYLTHVLSPVIGSIGVISGVILGFLSDDVVVAAIVAAGGVAAAGVPIMLSTRRKAAEVAASVGPVNGAGSIQEQLKTISTTLGTLATNDRHTLDRLENHEGRLNALEFWQSQFGVDKDDRLNPPKEAP